MIDGKMKNINARDMYARHIICFSYYASTPLTIKKSALTWFVPAYNCYCADQPVIKNRVPTMAKAIVKPIALTLIMEALLLLYLIEGFI